MSVHGCKTFNYVGGLDEHAENILRKKAFVDVLERHGLLVEETRIRDYDFTRGGGRQAFTDFRSMGLDLPDAVVCANDNMAIGYMEKVLELGYRVPEDTIITGFDGLFEAQCCTPGITSVGRGKEILGAACVEQILGMIEGKEYSLHTLLPFELRTNESCGCKNCLDSISVIKKRLNENLYQNQQLRWRMNLMQKRLLTCKTSTELNRTLYSELQALNINKCAIMLNEEEYMKHFTSENGVERKEGAFSDQMRVLYQGKPEQDSRSFETFETVRLLPEKWMDDSDDSHVYLFMPLHLNGIQYGYCVMGDHIDYIENENLFYWVSTMDLVIDHVRQNISIRMLNDRLSHMYIQDAMTGIYNRFALKNFGEPLLERNRMEGRRTLFLFADMDGLKSINDTYGHEVGDLSIKEMAHVMQQTCPDSSYFCIRYGGDEFLMMGTCDSEEKAALIQSAMEQSLDEYISQADQMMYQIKKERKHGNRECNNGNQKRCLLF